MDVVYHISGVTVSRRTNNKVGSELVYVLIPSVPDADHMISCRREFLHVIFDVHIVGAIRLAWVHNHNRKVVVRRCIQPILLSTCLCEIPVQIDGASIREYKFFT